MDLQPQAQIINPDPYSKIHNWTKDVVKHSERFVCIFFFFFFFLNHFINHFPNTSSLVYIQPSLQTSRTIYRRHALAASSKHRRASVWVVLPPTDTNTHVERRSKGMWLTSHVTNARFERSFTARAGVATRSSSRATTQHPTITSSWDVKTGTSASVRRLSVVHERRGDGRAVVVNTPEPHPHLQSVYTYNTRAFPLHLIITILFQLGRKNLIRVSAGVKATSVSYTPNLRLLAG